jgi:hypothetical protein
MSRRPRRKSVHGQIEQIHVTISRDDFIFHAARPPMFERRLITANRQPSTFKNGPTVKIGRAVKQLK